MSQAYNIDCDDDGAGSESGTYRFGNLNTAWDGGSSDQFRLSPWLGDKPIDFDSHMMKNFPNLLCQNDTYEFCLLSGSNLSWEFTPSDWFEVISSNTTCIEVRVNSGINVNGIAKVEAMGNFSYGICSFHDTLIHEFWVGPPNFNLIASPTYACPGDFGIATVVEVGGFVQEDYTWTFTGAISGTGSLETGKYRVNFPGVGYVCASVSNNCGSSSKCVEVQVEDCEFF
jgi:hypothetical protein